MISSNFLQLHSISNSTRTAYYTGLSSFLFWFSNLRPSTSFPTTYEQLDKLLVQYCHAMYFKAPTRGNRQLCLNARCAIVFLLPNSRFSLAASYRAINGWNRLVPSCQIPPFPYPVLLCFVERCLSRRNLALALILLLSFHGLLRISEALNLTTNDVTFPTTSTPGGLRLRATKTGFNQSCIIKDKVTWDLLKDHLSRKSTSSNLFSVSYHSVLESLNSLSVEFGTHPLKPHSLRHGGAVHLYLNDVPVRDIAQRGRWASYKTLSRYLQTGRALLLTQQVDQSTSKRGKELVANTNQLVKVWKNGTSSASLTLPNK